jgi:hypothetical protein
MLDLIQKAHKNIDSLRQYKKFADLFIKPLEPCAAASKRATLHLVVPKLQLLEKLLSLLCSNNVRGSLCKSALKLLKSARSSFLTDAHFFATLLSPWHKDKLKLWYTDEQISGKKSISRNSLVDL